MIENKKNNKIRDVALAISLLGIVGLTAGLIVVGTNKKEINTNDVESKISNEKFKDIKFEIETLNKKIKAEQDKIAAAPNNIIKEQAKIAAANENIIKEQDKAAAAHNAIATEQAKIDAANNAIATEQDDILDNKINILKDSIETTIETADFTWPTDADEINTLKAIAIKVKKTTLYTADNADAKTKDIIDKLVAKTYSYVAADKEKIKSIFNKIIKILQPNFNVENSKNTITAEQAKIAAANGIINTEQAKIAAANGIINTEQAKIAVANENIIKEQDKAASANTHIAELEKELKFLQSLKNYLFKKENLKDKKQDLETEISISKKALILIKDKTAEIDVKDYKVENFNKTDDEKLKLVFIAEQAKKTTLYATEKVIIDKLIDKSYKYVVADKDKVKEIFKQSKTEIETLISTNKDKIAEIEKELDEKKYLENIKKLIDSLNKDGKADDITKHYLIKVVEYALKTKDYKDGVEKTLATNIKNTGSIAYPKDEKSKEYTDFIKQVKEIAKKAKIELDKDIKKLEKDTE